MIYVDDSLITSERDDLIEETKKALGKEFQITDLGEENYFLGIKFEKGKLNFSQKLSQAAYVDTILERFQMSQSRSVSTPMTAEFAARHNVYRNEAKEDRREDLEVPYRELIGCLLYLAR